MTATPQERKLVGKLAAILADIPRVEKRGHNSHFKYDYAMEADFLDVVRPLLAAKGIFVTSSIASIDRQGEITTVQTRHAFHDSETGEVLEVMGAGQGADKQDKGVYKAVTGAMKYFIAKNFLISTGDDPEKVDEEKPKATKGKVIPWEERAKAEAVPQTDHGTFQDRIKSGSKVAESKPGDAKQWILYKVETEGHGEFTTFSKTVIEAAKEAKAKGILVTIHATPTAKGPVIEEIEFPTASKMINTAAAV
jgi:hypothetical protein